VTVYLRGVRQFTEHLAVHHPRVSPETVARRHVEDLLAELGRTGKAAATRRVRLNAEVILPLDAGRARHSADCRPHRAGVRAPDVPLPPVRVVTDDHLRAVLATCTGGDFASLCDAAILRVLIACGLASALALFSRSPFDFERWAVSFVNGQPNQKQVGDKGIDGVARFATNGRGGIGRALISVKGGRQLNPSMVRDLGGTVTTQQAEMGILITNGPPTRGMIDGSSQKRV